MVEPSLVDARRFRQMIKRSQLRHVGDTEERRRLADLRQRLLDVPVEMREAIAARVRVRQGNDRADLVAAFSMVDYVVVFPDLTVERLLTTLRPEVHCKGCDYTVDTVPERGVVRAYGGRTVIVGDAKDHSTRDVIARIRAQPGE